MTTATALSSSVLSTLSTLSGNNSTVGAKLDVNALVTQLVAADRAPRQNIITSQQTADTAEVSALGALKSALSTFQTAAQALAAPAAFNTSKATSSNSQIVSATTDATAGTGSYTVQVAALALSHQLASGVIVGGSTAVIGTGTLTFGQGAKSFAVTIDTTDNTLQGIANAINSAPGNSGVQATILTESGGAHLLLTASQTGAASAITVTASGGDGGLSQLNYNAGTKNMSELQPAQDSHIKIGTFDHFASTNAVSDAVTGVTFNLASASPGTNVTVSVSPDNTNITSLVSTFVSAYNTLAGTISTLDSYDPTSKTAGALLGDATLSGIERQLRQDLSKAVGSAAGSYNTLSSIGVTKLADGTLSFNAAKLSTALTQSPDAVAQIFASGDGVAARLDKDISNALSSAGAVGTRIGQLNTDLRNLQRKNSDLDTQMAALQTSYTAQFTALDRLLAQLQTTSSFLTQQFALLQKNNSG